jgi:hypothetical protein
MQEAAQAALDCQDACNLSGVVFTFAEAMQAICDEQHRLNEGTEWKNSHPVVTLFLSKLSELNMRQWPESAYYDAQPKVRALAEQVAAYSTKRK